jgi:hypothetical protein
MVSKVPLAGAGGVLGFLLGLGALFTLFAVLAPYYQRNEAREELRQRLQTGRVRLTIESGTGRPMFECADERGYPHSLVVVRNPAEVEAPDCRVEMLFDPPITGPQPYRAAWHSSEPPYPDELTIGPLSFGQAVMPVFSRDYQGRMEVRAWPSGGSRSVTVFQVRAQAGRAAEVKP